MGDADILSTALFVMGREDALAYAQAHAIGVYLVDDTGTPASFPARLRWVERGVHAGAGEHPPRPAWRGTSLEDTTPL